MDSVIRAAVVYGVLLLMFRLTGKRALGQITTFDAVLVLIISVTCVAVLLAAGWLAPGRVVGRVVDR